MKKIQQILLYAIVAMFIIACGSSGEDDGEISITTKSITGTAAAGAPIVGIINVKGANGTTASSPIELDGTYSIDVTALTEPYILFAEGSVNGKSVKYFSSGVVGVINISHITDYILRNATPTQLNDVYTNWANSQVSTAALTTAGNVVVQQLAKCQASCRLS